MGIENNNLQEKKSAISEIIIAYEQDVWNYAFSLTRKIDIADDITQDVFLKAYQKIDSFRGESSVKTWLLAITRNAVSDYRRSAFFRKVTLVDYIFDKGSHPSAENEVIDNMILNDVRKTVLRLPTKLREVLVLQVTHQLSIAEISSLLGISEAAVKTRLHRARNKVSIMMMQEGEFDGKVPV